MNNIRLSSILFPIVCLISQLVMASHVPGVPDTILVNGKVITADSDDIDKVTIAEAIAIHDGKIVAVGSNETIRRMAVTNTEVIDLGSRTVVPGLIDTHMHLYETALGFPWAANMDPQLLNIRLTAESVDEFVKIAEAAIRARAKDLGPGKWIDVSGNPSNIAHAAYGRLITRAVLDEWAPANPVIIRTRASAVINTLAINAFEEFYGQPIPEEYWLEGGKAVAWSGNYVDFPRCMGIDLVMSKRMKDYEEIFKSVLQVNAQNGVTTHATHAQCINGYNVGLNLDRAGQMPIRWAWSDGWGHVFNPEPEQYYKRVVDSAGYGSDYFWSLGMNPVNIDAGAIAMCTTINAAPDIKERELCPVKGGPGEVYTLRVRAMKAAIQNGLNIAPHHVAGDGGLDIYLDVIENSGLTIEEIRALRLQTDHCHQVRQDQIQRAKNFDMTFGCDASAEVNEVIARDYGDEYLTRYAPLKSMMDAGIKATINEFGSQSEVVSSPFITGYKFITRRSLDGKIPIGVPEEAIPDRMTMLLMMTRWGAHPIMKENTLGSLEAGKLADLVVLDQDVLTVPIEELPKVVPLMTMVGGKIVFEDPAFRGNTLRFNTQSTKWEKDIKTTSKLWKW